METTTASSYVIVFDSDMVAFEKKVKFFQNKGWTCQGGVSVDNKVLYQAMVKVFIELS